MRWNYLEIIFVDDVFRYCFLNIFVDEGFVVMLFYGCCIDFLEVGFDCFIDEVGGVVFFLGCVVDEGWYFGEGWGWF